MLYKWNHTGSGFLHSAQCPWDPSKDVACIKSLFLFYCWVVFPGVSSPFYLMLQHVRKYGSETAWLWQLPLWSEIPENNYVSWELDMTTSPCSIEERRSHDVSPTIQCWWWITEVHCSHLGSPGSFSSAVRSFYDWLTFPNISLMVLGKASHTHSVYISLGISLICRFWLSGAGSGLRVGILNKHPGDADASGPGTTLWVAKV